MNTERLAERLLATVAQENDELRTKVNLLAKDNEYAERCIDELMRFLRLDVERFRTESGRLNLGKVQAALTYPDEYAPLRLALADQPVDIDRLKREVAQYEAVIIPSWKREENEWIGERRQLIGLLRRIRDAATSDIPSDLIDAMDEVLGHVILAARGGDE